MRATTEPTRRNRLELTEAEIVQQARDNLSRCDWETGRLASLWTEKYSAGRGDAEFAALIGLDRSAVTYRRNVWDRFSGLRESLPNLAFTHFRQALAWDDAEKLLRWANGKRATVRQMLSHREDLYNLQADRGGNGKPGKSPPATPPEKPSGRRQTAPQTPRESPAAAEPSPAAETRPAASSGPPAPAAAEPARTVTRGEAFARLEEWRGIASPRERSKAAEDLAVKLVGMVDQTARGVLPVVDALLGAIVRSFPESEFPEIGQALSRWAGDFGPVAPLELSAAPTQGEIKGVANLIQTVIDAWNQLGHPFARVEKVTKSRRRALSTLVRDPFFRANWERAMEIVRTTNWLRGENKRGWVATIDWFLRPDTVVRMVESTTHAGERLKPQDARSAALDDVFGAMLTRATEVRNGRNGTSAD